MKVICDNQATLYVACNQIFYVRTKHFKVDYHFIIEKIELGCVATSFAKTN